MRKIFTVTIVFALAIAFSSCATRKVSRVNTNEVIDLSGRWNDTDSQLVSAEMIGDLLGARWLPVYESQHNNKRPVVVVGTVTNKSHEHINSETFIKDIEKEKKKKKEGAAGENGGGKNGRNYVPNGTNKTKVILRRRQLKNGDWNWVPISCCKEPSIASSTATKKNRLSIIR